MPPKPDSPAPAAARAAAAAEPDGGAAATEPTGGAAATEPTGAAGAVEPGRTAEFTRHLGIESLGMIDGAFVLELRLDGRHMSMAERAHGGVLFTLLDTALGRAVIAELPPGRGCATVEMKINYFRPVQHGTIRARGRCVQRTRSLAYAEGEILDSEGKTLARATGTFFLTDTLRQPDRERI